MNPTPPYVERKARVDDVIKIMMEKRTSSIPIVDDSSGKRVIAIVTERDVLPTTENFGVPIKEVMNEKCITATPGMMISDVSKIMVRNRLRRLPVIAEDELIGIVTVFDVLRFLGYGEFRGMTKAEEILSETRVEDIMAKKVVTMKPEDDISAVTKAVKEMGIGGFPVVEDGEIVGIVTTSDVISYVYRD
jgi:CBS domain-containing protein